MEIRPARLNDLDPLSSAASQDGHAVIRPTHVAISDCKYIGYASIGAVPMVVFWMDSKHARSVQTFKMEKFCEDELRKHGITMVCAPCAPESPIHPYMEKLGFRSFGRMDIFLKAL